MGTKWAQNGHGAQMKTAPISGGRLFIGGERGT